MDQAWRAASPPTVLICPPRPSHAPDGLPRELSIVLVASNARAGSLGNASARCSRPSVRRLIAAHLSATIRRVAANAAIAAILVGVAPRSTEAAAPVFDPRTPSLLAGVDVGLRASPAFGDLDRDGDLDMLSGEYGGAFRYYPNTGSGSPAFVEQTGAQNPANALAAASVHSQPALVAAGLSLLSWIARRRM